MSEPVSIDGAEHVHDLLSDYLNGDLSDDQRQAIQAHLATCSDCRRDFESLRLTVLLVRQAPLQPVPRAFTIPAPPPRRSWSLVWLRASTGALAALFVAVLAIQLVFPTASAPAASASRPTDETRALSARSDASSSAAAAAPLRAVAAQAPAHTAGASAAAPTSAPVPAPAAAPAVSLAAQASTRPATPPAGAVGAAAESNARQAQQSDAGQVQPTVVSGAAAQSPGPVNATRVQPEPANRALPTWYVPLLVAIGVLFALSLAGLIRATVRR